MTFDDYWKANFKRLHSENPWREELAREVWEANLNEFKLEFNTRLEKISCQERYFAGLDNIAKVNYNKGFKESIILPERRIYAGDNWAYSYSEAHAWNDCLDTVIKLNKKENT